MHRNTMWTVFLAGALLAPGWALSQPTSLEVIIDAGGQAEIRDRRRVTIPADGQLTWDRIAERTDARSLHLVDTLGAALHLIDQRFDFAPATRREVLKQYVDHPITLVRRDRDGRIVERATGVLLSAEGDRVALFRQDDGSVLLNPPGEVVLPPLPKPAIRPASASFALRAPAGPMELELRYLTAGLSWSAAYHLWLDSVASNARLSGTVTVSNRCGLDLQQARLRLQARVKRLIEGFQPIEETTTVQYGVPSFTDNIDLPDEESRTATMLSTRSIPIKVRNVFDPLGSGPAAPTPPQKLNRVLRLSNQDDASLGIPLPAGQLFIHEVTGGLDALPLRVKLPALWPDDAFEVSLGQAPGLEGKRRQTEFREVGDRTQEQDIEITLTNNTALPQRIFAIEHPWGRWQITRSSIPYTQRPDRSIEFALELPGGGQQTITYTVRWKY